MSKHRIKTQPGKPLEEERKSHHVREKRTNTVMGGNEQPDLSGLFRDSVSKTRSLPTSPGGREIRGRSSTIEYAGETKR
jgi:hypothetical protein